MRSTLRKILGAAVLAGAILVQALPVAAGSAVPDPGPVPELAAANNQFAFEMLQQLHKANPQENIIYSPLSVSTALSIASVM